MGWCQQHCTPTAASLGAITLSCCSMDGTEDRKDCVCGQRASRARSRCWRSCQLKMPWPKVLRFGKTTFKGHQFSWVFINMGNAIPQASPSPFQLTSARQFLFSKFSLFTARRDFKLLLTAMQSHKLTSSNLLYSHYNEHSSHHGDWSTSPTRRG